jgi:DNA-binding NtrC family response regulator
MDRISSKNMQDDSGRQVIAVGAHFTAGGSEDAPEQRPERRQERSSQAIILVIDDDMTIRSLLHEALNLRGYHVTAVGTVQEAEDILQQSGAAALGLVITDIQLTTDRQAREGYMLYQRWRASHPALPFLLISGDPSNQTLPAIRTGAVHFLPKPFTISALLETVQQLFRQ